MCQADEYLLVLVAHKFEYNFHCKVGNVFFPVICINILYWHHISEAEENFIHCITLNTVFYRIHALPQIDAPSKNFWIMYLKSVDQIYLSSLFNDLLNAVLTICW